MNAGFSPCSGTDFRLELYHQCIFGREKPQKHKKIIETGCGTGEGLKYIAKLSDAKTSIGIDIAR